MRAMKRESSNAKTETETEGTSPGIRIALKTALLPRRLMRMVARVEIDEIEIEKAVATMVARTKTNQAGSRRAISKMSSAERPSSSQSRLETP